MSSRQSHLNRERECERSASCGRSSAGREPSSAAGSGGDDFAQLASEKKNLADDVHPEQNSQQSADGAIGVWILLKKEAVQRQKLASGDPGERAQHCCEPDITP